MRYDDASQASSASAEPIARADTETLPQGSFGPATGNAISGAGTTSGADGADSVTAAPATIAAVQGAGGATGVAAGSFHAVGQYGVLSMDAEGNFSYVRNAGTPDGVQDVFQYTLADAAGGTSSTTLTIDITQAAAAAASQAMVNLPAGVEMSDIHVNGRDLVIDMPDGTQMVIPGGAVFVPELMIGDVQVPPTNLAALLINSEPQPAAGPPQSSGGNFAEAVPPLDPGVPLGDLIPPTELHYTPPEFEELANAIDHKPTVIIITPDNPAGAVDAVANVDESGLPARGSEPEGTLEPQNIETTSGTIVFVAEDGLDSITVGGAAVTAVGQQIGGAHGVLTITSIDLGSGQIGFSYTATDNTTQGVDDFEDFPVGVTDSDGDTATGNLHINIADDAPIALDDTDTLNADEQTADGNVMTGAGTTTGAAGHDTVGADNASLTAVSGADGSDSSFNGDGNLVVHGAYGTLSIDAQGDYTYVRDAGAPDNVSDVFEYTLTDGDGDTATATLTIIVPDLNEPPVVAGSTVNVSEEGLVGGNPDTSGTPDTTNEKIATGDIGLSDPDGDATTVTLGVPTGSYTSGGDAVHWAVSADGHSLVGYTGSDSTANHVIEVTINDSGAYTVNLVQPFDDPNVAIEDSISFTVPVSVNDGTETVSTTIAVTVEDDAPNAINDTDSLSGNNMSTDGNVVSGVGTTNGGADSYGGDGPGSVTGIHPGTSGSFTAVPQDGADVTVHGTFGDLVIHDDGSYTYTRYDNAVTGGTDVFTYQLTDGDGDTDTATLTITVPNINTTPSIVSADDAIIDEDGLPGANSDSNPLQVDPDETASTGDASFEGQIHVDFKTDVPGDLTTAIALVDTTALDGQLETLDGKDIVFALESGVLVGRPDGGGDALVTIAITGVTAGSGGNATYTYEVNLLGPVQHAGGTELTSAEDSVSLTGVTFEITDSNNDHATGTFDVSVTDDVPTASLSDRGVPGITLDESAAGTDSSDGSLPNGLATDTVDFSTAFATPVYGADGEGSHSYTLNLCGSNVGSGLYALDATDTDPTGGLGKGAEIMLVDNGDGTISGMVGTDEYFVISVNSSTGEVTFTQEMNIWHPIPGTMTTRSRSCRTAAR
jgi:VCBS repeat-containing protein